MTPGIVTALRSDCGQVRDNNEDSIAEDRELGLLVLADGMGGHNAGEVASQIATATVVDHIRAAWPLREPEAGEEIGTHSPEARLLHAALTAANTAIHEAAQRDRSRHGMGTTALAVLLLGHRLVAAYVGDSRLYRLRGDTLECITRDHSLVEELVATGRLSRAEAAQQFSRNIVTRALGVDPTVEIDLIEQPVQPQDLYLLCSDGLTDMVDDEHIAAALREFGDNLDATAERLIGEANARGGHDNISVALARVDAAPAGSRSWWGRIGDWF